MSSNKNDIASFSGSYLRFCEYYNQMEIHDKLYKQSSEGKNFKKLMKLITSERNILLAYRVVKTNKGAMTPGCDGKTILDLKRLEKDKFVRLIRNSIINFSPSMVKRVMIPKQDGRERPLGIPTIKDRIIQQCIKQIMEPILEAKFYKHSYGFRPLRSTKDALSELYRRLSIGKNSYVVDIDIKSFFDEVDHTVVVKLLKKQGILDSQLLKIISLMLNAEIENIGRPEKGVPQGGILSPLLANLVLNELDWYIAKQWESFNTKKEYTDSRIKFNELNRTSNLKSGFIIRYADDFKICCKTKNEAERWFSVTKKFLHDKLKLEISESKSGVTNVREKSTEFLGINFLIKQDISNNRSFQVRTRIATKAKEKLVEDLRQQLKNLKKYPENAGIVNTIINGKLNYYSFASEITSDMSEVYFRISGAYKSLEKQYGKTTFHEYCKKHKRAGVYDQFKDYRFSVPLVNGIPIIHVKQYTFSRHKYFNQKCNIYTSEGRKYIGYKGWDNYMMDIFNKLNDRAIIENTQFHDNKLSRFGMVSGRCEISGIMFLTADEIHAHHIIPRSSGGSDEFNNLLIVHKDIHTILHTRKEKTVEQMINDLPSKLSSHQMKKLKKYREIAIQSPKF